MECMKCPSNVSYAHGKDERVSCKYTKQAKRLSFIKRIDRPADRVLHWWQICFAHACSAYATMANAHLLCPTFDGSSRSNARHFLELFDGYCASANINNNERVLPLLAAMKDTALTWIRLWRDANDAHKDDFARLRTAFEARFAAEMPRASRVRTLMTCQQRAGEHAHEFWERCLVQTKACLTNTPPDWNALHVAGDHADEVPDVFKKKLHFSYQKELCINVFCWGLLPQLKERVLAANWTTSDECLEAARHQEEALLRSRPGAGDPIAASYADMFYAATHPDPYFPPDPFARADAAPILMNNIRNAPQHYDHLPLPRGRGRGRARGRGGPAPPGRGGTSAGPSRATTPQPSAPQGRPHPRQQRSHDQPIVCHWCGGQYHTERYCLAKQAYDAAQGNGGAGAAQPAGPQHPSVAAAASAVTPAATAASAPQPGQDKLTVEEMNAILDQFLDDAEDNPSAALNTRDQRDF